MPNNKHYAGLQRYSWTIFEGSVGPWSYGRWIYNYLYNWYLSPLMLWVRIPLMARCTTLCDKVCQWLVAGCWFSSVSSTNKTDRHDITEILLKMALNTINRRWCPKTICILNSSKIEHLKTIPVTIFQISKLLPCCFHHNLMYHSMNVKETKIVVVWMCVVLKHQWLK